ncbi:MAG: PD-(D/E)XK nuclease family protein, partial [Terriglobales bacterium]
LEQRPDVRHSEFFQYERNEITFRLNRFFTKELQRAQQDQEEFVPLLEEASFGMTFEAQSSPHLILNVGGRQVKIRGRIDRIDVAASTLDSAEPRVRIIDYKSGSSPITKDDAYQGRNIQLPLYALAVERSILPGSKVVSGAYLSVSSGDFIGRLAFDPSQSSSRSGSDDAALLNLTVQHVENFVTGIESGDFSVAPNTRTLCARCPHRPVCRVKELPESVVMKPRNVRED